MFHSRPIYVTEILSLVYELVATIAYMTVMTFNSLSA